MISQSLFKMAEIEDYIFVERVKNNDGDYIKRELISLDNLALYLKEYTNGNRFDVMSKIIKQIKDNDINIEWWFGDNGFSPSIEISDANKVIFK